MLKATYLPIMKNCWSNNCHTNWEENKYDWSTETVKYASTKTTACNYNKANDTFLPTWCPSIGWLSFFFLIQSQRHNTSRNNWIPSLKQWNTEIMLNWKVQLSIRKPKGYRKLRPWRTNVPTDRIWERLCTLNMPAKTPATMPHQIWEWRGVWRVGCILEKIEGNRPSLPSPRYNLDCLCKISYDYSEVPWFAWERSDISIYIYIDIYTWT